MLCAMALVYIRLAVLAYPDGHQHGSTSFLSISIDEIKHLSILSIRKQF